MESGWWELIDAGFECFRISRGLRVKLLAGSSQGGVDYESITWELDTKDRY